MKNVSIPYELFSYLVDYHLNGEEYLEEEIRDGLEEKLEAMRRRELYSRYKTAPDEVQREEARQEYLDSRGVPASYRWTVSPWKQEQERGTLLCLADKAKAKAGKSPSLSPQIR